MAAAPPEAGAGAAASDLEDEAQDLRYPGLWCSHDLVVHKMTDGTEDTFRVAFSFTCRVRVSTLPANSLRATPVLVEETCVRLPASVVSALHEPAAFCEQWVSSVDAVQAAISFSVAEEVALEGGEVVWEQDGQGRTTLAADKRSARWRVGSSEFEIRAIDKSGALVAWGTRQVAVWVLARDLLGRLSACLLETGLWVRLCTTALGVRFFARLRRRGLVCGLPVPRARFASVQGP